jgi:hypothetical protein
MGASRYIPDSQHLYRGNSAFGGIPTSAAKRSDLLRLPHRNPCQKPAGQEPWPASASIDLYLEAELRREPHYAPLCQ